ncbi:MAG: DUF5116 domain-containing protein [Sphingobacteriaceae bacterium]|nr:MAG: DUF5116 domain-containing protein [Sphingobacteriaceae bacterium]
MKKTLISFLTVCSALLMLFSSCKKDGTQTISSIGTAGTLSASTTAPALSLATAANAAVTLSFPATTVTGYQTALTYSIQVDKKGNNFASAREIAATAPATNVTVGTLNTALLNLGLATGTSTQIDVRVKSTIAANAAPVYSNIINLTVTPYTLTSYVYVPGAYQGWDPTKADVGTLSSPTSNNIYDGKITFPAGSLEFKITPAQSWNVSYGGSNNVLSLTGGNLSVPSAGTYLVHADFNAFTYTLTKQ